MKTIFITFILAFILQSCASPKKSTTNQSTDSEKTETMYTEKAIERDTAISTEWKRISVNGVEREFLIKSSAECFKKSCSLIFVFHGGFGEPEQIEKHSAFTDLAVQENFIVVYPRGLKRQWNDGRPGQHDKVDDMAFFDQMWEAILKDYKFDSKRVFATGISNGGFFSFRLACERSHIILGAAPVAANHSVGVLDKCKPAHPVSILNIVGTEDQTVPYGGGDIAVLFRFRKRGEVLSSEQTVKSWIQFNSCSQQPVVQTIDQLKDDGTSIKIETYERGCRQQSRVKRISVVGGGHTWPGHPPTHRGSFHSSVTSMEIDATREIWNFFKSIQPRQ